MLYNTICLLYFNQMSGHNRRAESSSGFSRPGGRSPGQVRRSGARAPSQPSRQAHHVGSRAGGSRSQQVLSPTGGVPPPLPPR